MQPNFQLTKENPVKMGHFFNFPLSYKYQLEVSRNL